MVPRLSKTDRHPAWLFRVQRQGQHLPMPGLDLRQSEQSSRRPRTRPPDIVTATEIISLKRLQRMSCLLPLVTDTLGQRDPSITASFPSSILEPSVHAAVQQNHGRASWQRICWLEVRLRVSDDSSSYRIPSTIAAHSSISKWFCHTYFAVALVNHVLARSLGVLQLLVAVQALLAQLNLNRSRNNRRMSFYAHKHAQVEYGGLSPEHWYQDHSISNGAQF